MPLSCNWWPVFPEAYFEGAAELFARRSGMFVEAWQHKSAEGGRIMLPETDCYFALPCAVCSDWSFADDSNMAALALGSPVTGTSTNMQSPVKLEQDSTP